MIGVRERLGGRGEARRRGGGGVVGEDGGKTSMHFDGVGAGCAGRKKQGVRPREVDRMRRGGVRRQRKRHVR